MQNSNNVTLISDATKADNLKQAKELVKHLEQGNIEQADSIIYAFCETRENDMFPERCFNRPTENGSVLDFRLTI